MRRQCEQRSRGSSLPIGHRVFLTGLMAAAALVCFGGLTAGAPGDLEWVRRFGGEGSESAAAVLPLAGGDRVLVGSFQRTLTLGSGPGQTTLVSEGGYDLFIARFAPDWTLRWARRAGGPERTCCTRAAALPDGGVVLTGCIDGAATFGRGEAGETTLVSAGRGDAFVAKFNPDGTLAWARRIGGPGWDYGLGVAVAEDGGVFVTGHVQGPATFESVDGGGEVVSGPGGVDVFVARYGAGGALRWVSLAGGELSGELGYAVAALPDGGCAAVGEIMGTATFGHGAVVSEADSGSRDGFIARYTAGGAVAWVRRLSGRAYDSMVDVALLAGGDLVVTGSFGGFPPSGNVSREVTFSAGEPDAVTLSATRGGQVFLACYGLDGSLRWVQQVVGEERGWGLGVHACEDGGVLMTGFFRGAITLGTAEPGETTLSAAPGRGDVVLARYEPDGSLAWARAAGGAGWDCGVATTTASDGAPLLTGQFEDVAAFGAGEPNATALVSRGAADIFVARFEGPAAGPFTIVATAGPGGWISPEGELLVEQGETVTFYMVPESGWEVQDVLVDGVSVGPVPEHTFTDVQQAHTIHVSFRSAYGDVR